MGKDKISFDELEKLLRENEEWLVSDRTKGKRGDVKGRSIVGLDLSNRNLTEFNLRRANLDKVNLSDSRIYGADAQHASCKNANFSRARMAGVDLSEAILESANFKEADLRGSKLKRANLAGADFEGAQCIGTDFLKADMNGTNWKNASIIAVNLFESTLDGAHFEETTIDEVTFKILQAIRPDVRKDRFIITGSLKHDRNSIRRTISFPPEYYQAGMLILQHFCKLLDEYYVDEKPNISIQQVGLKVTMVISPPIGEKVTIERHLDDYGLVVVGKLQPEEYFSDPLKVLELKNLLRVAYLQVEHQREIIQLKESQYKDQLKRADERLVSLEEQINWMRKLVADGVSGYKSQIERLIPLLETNKDATKLLLRLEELLEDAETITGKESREVKGIIKKLQDMIFSGIISGMSEQLIINLINTARLYL